MTSNGRAIVAYLALALACSQAAADVPARLNYQGRFTDPGGSPIIGAHTAFFSIYQGGSAGGAGSGALVFRESVSVNLSDGILSHEIGTGLNLVGGILSVRMVDFAGDVYVEVALDSVGNAVLPRSRLDSAPFALQAERALGANRLVRDYVVASFSPPVFPGEVVAFLDQKIGHFLPGPGPAEYTFNSASTSRCAVATLAVGKYVIVFIDEANSNALTAVVATVASGVITYGPKQPIASGVDQCAVTALDGAKVMAVYSDSSACRATVGAISGSNITFGAAYPFSASATGGLDVSVNTASSALIAFVDNGNAARGTSLLASVTSGNVISFGAPAIFNTGPTSSPRIVRSTTNQLVVAFCDGTTAGYATFGNLSGTSVTYGQKNAFNYGLTSSIDVHAFSGTQIAIGFVDDAHDSHGRIVGGQLFTGVKTIGFGPPAPFNSEATADVSIDGGIIAYREATGSNAGRFVVYSTNTSNHTFNFSSEGTFNNSATSFVSLNGIIAFRDDGDSGFGKAIAFKDPLSSHIAGISLTSGQPGQTVPVAIGGISNAHSGLSPGAFYYTTGFDQTLTTASGTIRVGRAVSPTELLMDPGLSFH